MPYLLTAKSGGRIRTTHKFAPDTSNYKHVLRMEDPGKGRKGKLFEVTLTNDGKMATHPSRGALIKAGAFGLGKAKIARKIGQKLQTENFRNLAQCAKAANRHYINHGGTKNKHDPSDEEVSRHSNQRFLDSLPNEIKKRIPMNSI